MVKYIDVSRQSVADGSRDDEGNPRSQSAPCELQQSHDNDDAVGDQSRTKKNCDLM